MRNDQVLSHAAHRGRSARHEHTLCPVRYPNYAAGAFHAHRLWTNLWMSLGHPEENPVRPEGNGAVSIARPLAVHSLTGCHACPGHSHCARPANRYLPERVLSPGSTDPMTTTSFVIADDSQQQVANRHTRSRPAPASVQLRDCGPDPINRKRPDQ